MAAYQYFDKPVEKRCCGLPAASYAVFIGALELIMSVCGVWYAWYGISYYDKYDSRILFHDNLYLEARNHYYSESSLQVSLDWIHVDMYFYMSELMLTLILVNGIITRNIGNVRLWLYVMLIYTLVVSGMFLGFIIGGISSSRLDIFGFLHAAFRFYEISVVYGFYETLYNPIQSNWRNNTLSSSISDLKEDTVSTISLGFDSKV